MEIKRVDEEEERLSDDTSSPLVGASGNLTIKQGDLGNEKKVKKIIEKAGLKFTPHAKDILVTFGKGLGKEVIEIDDTLMNLLKANLSIGVGQMTREEKRIMRKFKHQAQK